MKNWSTFVTPAQLFSDVFRYMNYAQKPNADLGHLKREWAQLMLSRLKVDLQIMGEPSDMKSMMFVGNHVSYMDIPLMMSSAKNISFVAKAEIGSWPVIGRGSRVLDTILVKRESGDSRTAARRAIKEGLENHKRIVLFPSGTTRLDESREWRRGSFEIAYEMKRPIQPFRLSYTPLRKVAYIDRDFLPWHMSQLSRLPKIEATLEFHEPVMVQDPAEDCRLWWQWAARRGPAPQAAPSNVVLMA